MKDNVQMAEQGIQLDQDRFCCSICLELLKDPVTTACGHSYCIVCITKHWDQDAQRGVYSCPQCRQTFTPRPVLMKNTMLAELVESLKKTGLQAAAPALCYAGPRDVACDVCTGRKQKALKSCLVCLASYCETHLQPHYDAAPLQKHKLVKASTQLQEKICPHHDKLFEFFCRTDQKCICYLCSMDKHKGHDIAPAKAERIVKQSQLGETQQGVQQQVQRREKEQTELREEVEACKHSALAAVEDCERIFTELIHSIERRRSEVKELIINRQNAAVSQAEGLMERLEQEIAELKRRESELEQLSHTDDHIHFLQSYASLSSVPSDSPSFTARPRSYFEDVVKAVREKLEHILTVDWTSIFTAVKEVSIYEPQTRADFLQYSCQLTLDPNTANTQLCLSQGNRKVTCGPAQSYPYHPDRFSNRLQVLCREGLCGRCYWEVEWEKEVSIAVSYKSIGRRDDECVFGRNNKSWRLYCCNGCVTFRHNKVDTVLQALGPKSSSVGVYLDHRAGTLAFYSISDTMTLLHRVHTTFTQPLYPGFRVNHGWTVELCELK